MRDQTEFPFDEYFCLWRKHFLKFMSHIFCLPYWMYYIEVTHMVDLSYAIIWYSFSVYITSSLSWMPSLFLHFLFTSITNISSWIYFGGISQKSKVPLLLGSSWGTQKDEQGATNPAEMHWRLTWLTHSLRDSLNTSYTQLCRARNLSSFLNEITGNLMLTCLKMAYK